ncbi:MAG: hypothetical protein FWG70_03735 [Oscillospiraceae bacterium]|nr:hypothetical protein [Oscillospiraceae bacterium]
MSESKRRRPMSVGIASLFAVLIVLCLMVFAVLARLSAKSELNLAERAAQTTTAFYDAEYRAVLRLTEIELSLYNVGDIITFAEEIDQNRELRVSLIVTEDGLVREEWAAMAKTADAQGQPEQQQGQGFGGQPKMIFEEE